jgi:hypothetical protein
VVVAGITTCGLVVNMNSVNFVKHASRSAVTRDPYSRKSVERIFFLTPARFISSARPHSSIVYSATFFFSVFQCSDIPFIRQWCT